MYDEVLFGKHATLYKGEPDLERIIQEEVTAKNMNLGQDSRMLVTGKLTSQV